MYSVKNGKSCIGRDGIAYSCTLHKDGKKIATVRNAGYGGPTSFDWVDRSEEKPFEDYAKTQTFTVDAVADFCDGAMLVAKLLDEADMAKKIKRLSKENMVFTLKGDNEPLRSMNGVYNSTMRDYVISKYGDKVDKIYDMNGIAVELPVLINKETK